MALPNESDTLKEGVEPRDEIEVYIEDEPAVELERSAMSPEEWPPTPWFEAWSEGRDLFDLPRDDAPMELRWVVYRRV